MKMPSLILALFLMVSCANAPATQSLHTPSYDSYGVTRLAVHDVQIINAYVPSYKAPNVEHDLFLPPYVALRDWAKARYQAVGSMGQAKVNIVEASIVKRDIPVKEDFGSIFRDQVNAEYNMVMKVRIEIISSTFDNVPFAEVEVKQSLRTTESQSAAQRDAMLHKMVMDGIAQMDSVMTQSIRTKLGNLVQ